MTTRSDFKTIVRARMARTGENYTTARAALELDREAARIAHERLIRPHVEGSGEQLRLLRIPARMSRGPVSTCAFFGSPRADAPDSQCCWSC